MTEPSVWKLHEQLGREMLELLRERGPLLLAGHVGSGSREFARELARHAPVAAVLDPLTAGGPEQLASQIISGLIARDQPLEPERIGEPTREAERFRVAVADRYHEDASEAVEIYAGANASGWSVTRAIGTATVQPLIVALEAHRLNGPTGALWELRDLASRGQISLLLSSRPHQQEMLLGSEAPFYGAIQTLQMPQLSPKDWMHAIDRAIAPGDLEWLLERTRGRTQTMIETLAAWPTKTSPRNAWRYAARARIPQAEELLRVSGAIHEFAPRLLSAIAADEPPYPAVVGARPNRIAKALSLLHEVDLIEQPRPRRWQIADPLLGDALRVLYTREQAWSVLGEEHPSARRTRRQQRGEP
jgi:hypothetical protein